MLAVSLATRDRYRDRSRHGHGSWLAMLLVSPPSCYCPVRSSAQESPSSVHRSSVRPPDMDTSPSRSLSCPPRHAHTQWHLQLSCPTTQLSCDRYALENVLVLVVLDAEQLKRVQKSSSVLKVFVGFPSIPAMTPARWYSPTRRAKKSVLPCTEMRSIQANGLSAR